LSTRPRSYGVIPGPSQRTGPKPRGSTAAAARSGEAIIPAPRISITGPPLSRRAATTRQAIIRISYQRPRLEFDAAVCVPNKFFSTEPKVGAGLGFDLGPAEIG